MATHFAVSRSPAGAGANSRAGASSPAASAIRWCATAAPSAARSRITIRRPAIPRPCWRLGATIHTDRRAIPADDFIVASFETALAPGEIITGGELSPRPRRPPTSNSSMLSSRFSIVGVFLARSGGAVRVGITGAGHHAFRAARSKRRSEQTSRPRRRARLRSRPTDLLSGYSRQRRIPRPSHPGTDRPGGRPMPRPRSGLRAN